MTGSILIPGAVILATYLLTRQATKLSTIEFSIQKARIHKITLTSIEAFVSLSYINPSNASQSVDALFFKIQKGGSAFGTIDRKIPFRVEPKTEKTVEVPVKISLVSGASAILSSLVGDKVDLTFDGYATVSGQEIRIKKTVPLELGGYLNNLRNLFKKKKK